MLLVADSEGDPIPEWSDILIDENKDSICNVFHAHGKYFYAADRGRSVRKHMHGLNSNYLSRHSVTDVDPLLCRFLSQLHPYAAFDMYANAPSKEETFLGRPVNDVRLLGWADRMRTKAHVIAKTLKFQDSANAWLCVPRSQPYRLLY